MTTITATQAQAMNALIANRYADLKFIPNDRPADRTNNFSRTSTKRSKRRTIR